MTAAESPRRYRTPHSGGQFAGREVGSGANREGSESGEDQPRRALNPRPLGLGLLLFFPQKLEEARVGLITLDLSGNFLTALPQGVFDELLLLEELTLHGNPQLSLPNGMFGDFS